MQTGGFKQLRGASKQNADDKEDDSTSQNPFASLFGGAKKAKVCAKLYLTLSSPHHCDCVQRVKHVQAHTQSTFPLGLGSLLISPVSTCVLELYSSASMAAEWHTSHARYE